MDLLLLKNFTFARRCHYISLLLSFFIISEYSSVNLYAAPPPPSRNPYGTNDSAQIKEVRDNVEDLRHQVSNHETEIRMMDEKLINFDAIIDNVRDQLSESSKVHREQLKGNSTSLEAKITALETTSKGVVADVRQFKTHANDASVALALYKQKIGELEKIIEQQNQNIEHLQAAMRSLMDALQVNNTPPVKNVAEAAPALGDDKVYRIKAGDSLEKIARNFGVSVQALRERNGLTNDKIVVGKQLQIPEK